MGLLGDLDVYSGKQEEGVYLPEGGGIQAIPAEDAASVPAENFEEKMAAGERIFASNCAA